MNSRFSHIPSAVAETKRTHSVGLSCCSAANGSAFPDKYSQSSGALADLWQQVPTGIGLGIHLLRNNRKDQMRRMFRVVINGLVGFQQLCIGSEG